MGDVVIRVEGLGKKYTIGHKAQRERYVALRDVMARNIKSVWRNTGDMLRGRPVAEGEASEDFWALKDVSFEVKRGEVLGIIGRNGAGKSTLLKILSRITEPSEGRVTIEGRVASLLEVGTGFHPELTGRENIYLNGAILGMSRAEIARKFDTIVAFAEVERFLDTPVKRYSSGMYVRLAFAVAAHLEPEILVVDEVLAVGDAEFQKKCLGRMGEVSKGGRTVLFVSHDMRKVTALCNRGILLDGGRIECEGAMAAVADTYMGGRLDTCSFADLRLRGDRSGSGDARFQSIALLNGGQPCRTFPFGQDFRIKLGVCVKRPIGNASLQARITTPDGVGVQEFFSANDDVRWPTSVGCYEFTIAAGTLHLYPGAYSIDLWIGDNAMHRVDYITDAITFSVIQAPGSEVSHPLDRANGLVYQRARWTIDEVDSQTRFGQYVVQDFQPVGPNERCTGVGPTK